MSKTISAGEVVLGRLRQAKYFLYSNYIPTLQIVLEACQRNEVEPELMWRDDVIDSVIERCITGSSFTGSGEEYYGKISENPTLRAAINGVYERYPRFARSMSNDQMIIEAAARHQTNFDAASLITMVTEDAVLFDKSLGKSEQWNDQQKALREREEGIAYLTKNGTSSFSVGKDWRGDPQTFNKLGYLVERSPSGERRIGGKDDKGFVGWTDEQVRYAVQEVKAKREYAQQQKDGTLGRNIDQTVKKNITERFHGNPYEYKPPMPTDKTIPAVLIDPRDGSAITTRLQLNEYINSDEKALARLVKPHGVTIPERARAVDILLASK